MKSFFSHHLLSVIFTRFYFTYKRYIEDPYYHLIKRHPELFIGGHILDIGANIGYTTHLFSKIVSEGYKVFAFEPDPINFNVLGQVIQSKQISKHVLPFQLAIGKEEGVVEFWQKSGSHADHRIKTDDLKSRHAIPEAQSLQINQTSIDCFAHDHKIEQDIKFIKIDVQGYEPSVLAGMQTVLNQSPHLAFSIEYCPNMLIEMGFNPLDFIQKAQDLQFQVYTIGLNGILKSISNLTDFSLPKRGYIELLLTHNKYKDDQA
ncbi:MAG: FkbM family methyltransferase [Anaerolineae bacterium]|nr:FkbM family methyltransferase [Anaerolineae bacterium]